MAKLHKTHNAALTIYYITWRLALPLLRWNQRIAVGFKERTLQEVMLAKADVWIQAASAGESYLAQAILGKLKPNKVTSVLLTSNTRQGMDILARAIVDITPNARGVNASAAFCPFDKPAIMESAVNIVQPRVMVLLESEIWPGLLAALKKYQSKILVLNGRMTPKSLSRYLLWPSIWHTLKPDKILAISEEDAERFARIFGREYVDVMPNIKFDNVDNTNHGIETENRLGKMIRTDTPFIVLGSTRREEERSIEKIILDIRRQRSESVIGLFPRHMHRINYWKKTLDRLAIPWVLRSSIEQHVPGGTVILWDSFGELSPAYKLAKSAFIGGTLAPLGGQNFLEPLTCGVIPVIGPSWENFAWIGKDIVEQGLVHVAADWQEVSDFLVAGLEKALPREHVRKAALKYLKNRQGGTSKACHLITKTLNDM
ncbi:MAG: 3-deoxy-D-manno-octulosonic acid transferase [Desulfobacterales bacterium]|nr:MAG: 3-deoxy-D-manno-octulosonic acid transferase [Desulfobacterales bacterium]